MKSREPSHYCVDLRKKEESKAPVHEINLRRSVAAPQPQETVEKVQTRKLIRRRTVSQYSFTFRVASLLVMLGMTLAPIESAFASSDAPAPEPPVVEVPAEPPVEEPTPPPAPEPVVEPEPEVSAPEEQAVEETQPEPEEGSTPEESESNDASEEENESEASVESENSDGEESVEEETGDESSEEESAEEENVVDEEENEEGTSESSEDEENTEEEEESSEEATDPNVEEENTESEEENTDDNGEGSNGGGGGVPPQPEEESSQEEQDTPPSIVVVKEDNNSEEEEELPEQSFVENDSRYVFDTADCVVVKDGEFYCVKGSNDHEHESLSLQQDELVGSVFAQKDDDGDLEIFFNYEGKIEQITDNAFDDDEPVYDASSGRIVWHALVDDRYQIFLYDIAADELFQLTDTSYNDTNPDVSGDTIVWQGWEDDNWEIFTLDYSIFLQNGGSASTTRITVTEQHDMFPKAHDSFVTWQSRTHDQWKSYGYNIRTGEQVYLGDGTQGDVESTRLVLLVERRNSDGDLERVGYEVDTGESISLGSTPKEIPEPPVQEDPLKDQQGVIPNTASTTVKTTTRDDGGDNDTPEDDIPPVEEL